MKSGGGKQKKQRSLTYQVAGVDIELADQFVVMIRKRIARAWPQVASQIGGFAGGGAIPSGATWVSGGADGAGTKAILGALFEKFWDIGYDAAAMSLVDTYVSGARPAYLWDVFDVGSLNPKKHIQVIDGIIAACRDAGASLRGGETAEAPDMFRHPWMVNINTTAIGFPARELRYAPVRPGQLVFGWPSYGFGSNGFSLVRRALRWRGDYRRILRKYRSSTAMQKLVAEVMRHTPIWINAIEEERKRGVRFAGHAHITGSGMPGNIPRMLPSNCGVVINRTAWQRPEIFTRVQREGRISDVVMDNTLNQGIMVVSIVDPRGKLMRNKNAILIGEVVRRKKNEPQVRFVGRFKE